VAHTLLDDLKQQIAGRKAVFVVGAGVSIQASGRHPCASWTGLLHNGAERCSELNQGLKDKWLDTAKWEIDSGDTDEMITAAERITTKLGGRTGGEYRRWLRESVGAIGTKPEGRAVLEALQGLALPIATTNYDGLIEEVSGRKPVTWRDTAAVERVLRGDDDGVLHLHGYWEQPESVVLGIRSYEEVLGSEHAQEVLRSLQMMTTVVFVGCGAGLSDPNFGALLHWTGSVFRNSEYRRYRLALDGEREALQKEHPEAQRIYLIGFGPTHDDLPAFLRSLAPATIVTTPPDPPRSAPPAPVPLPAKPPWCFGRDVEIEQLVSAILADPPQPMPILGTAGIGKTTLCLWALHDKRVARRYGTRRYFTRCDGIQSRTALASEIARHLGLDPSPMVENAALAALESAPAVLALDNLETPHDQEPRQVEELLGNLSSVPGLALVISMRGNRRPADVAWMDALRPQPLDLEAARRLFVSIAGKGFERDSKLDSLVNAVDRVPLAVTLLAHEAEGGPSLSGLWTRWQQKGTELLRYADGDDRLTNIELSYEISITGKRMTDEARRLLSVLALLPNGVAEGDLAAVAPEESEATAPILRQTGLAFDEAERLRLLAPLREYVRRKRPSGLADSQRVANFYLTLARDLGSRVGREGGEHAARRLTPEVGNVEQMVTQSLGTEVHDLAVEGAIAWAEMVRLTGAGTPRPLEEAAKAESFRENWLSAARCIKSLGGIALDRSEHEQARSSLEHALSLFRQVCNSIGEANCLDSLGDIAFERSEYEQAQARYEEALPLYRQVSSVLGEANCLRSLADIAFARSEYEQARARYEEALPLYRRIGSVLGEANCSQGLGDVALARSEHEQAKAHYEEALDLHRRVGSVLGEANCIQGLGDIALKESERDAAQGRFEQALALYERISEPYSIGLSHVRLARITDDRESRTRHLHEARVCFEKINRPDLVTQLGKEFGEKTKMGAG
jgi:tetratricopeptide (TPR) repeat protein